MTARRVTVLDEAASRANAAAVRLRLQLAEVIETETRRAGRPVGTVAAWQAADAFLSGAQVTVPDTKPRRRRDWWWRRLFRGVSWLATLAVVLLLLGWRTVTIVAAFAWLAASALVVTDTMCRRPVDDGGPRR